MRLQVRAYNIFKPIRELWSVSDSIVGRKIVYRSEVTTSHGRLNVSRDIASDLEPYMGERLTRIVLQTGHKFPMPGEIELEFPLEQEKVRDFFRLLVRTDTLLDEAARVTGVKMVSSIKPPLSDGMTLRDEHRKPAIMGLPVSGPLEVELDRVEKELATNPDHIAAWTHMGVLLTQLGRDREALTAYDRALSINPRFVTALLNKGVALTEIGEFEQALAVFDQAIAIEPENSMTHYNKGITLVKQGRVDEALQAFDEAIRINPKETDAIKMKYLIMSKMGIDTIISPNEVSMEKTLEQAFQYYLEGSRCAVKGDYQKALELFSKTLEILPLFDACWHDKGLALLKLGDPDGAIENFDRALEINPDLDPTRFFKAKAQLAKKEYDNALGTVDIVLAKRPRSVAGMHLKGLILERKGDLEAALAVYGQVLDINEKHADTWYNKGTILRRLGRNDEAEKCFNVAKRLGLV